MDIQSKRKLDIQNQRQMHILTIQQFVFGTRKNWIFKARKSWIFRPNKTEYLEPKTDGCSEQRAFCIQNQKKKREIKSKIKIGCSEQERGAYTEQCALDF